MSAYGPIKRSAEGNPLPTKLWISNSTSPHPIYVTTHHLTIASALRLEGLLDYLSAVFAKEVEDGFTYPQEGEVDRPAFDGYFFSADVIIAIAGETGEKEREEGNVDIDILTAQGGRPWSDCVAGFYYIKPNYPGRSSHICNAGFVVPPSQRSKGYGSLLAKSFLDYAPMAGYQASVFNLVYVNNIASVKLWERLNFTKAGLIPRAGRLKRKDGQGEEAVENRMSSIPERPERQVKEEVTVAKLHATQACYSTAHSVEHHDDMVSEPFKVPNQERASKGYVLPIYASFWIKV